jgi:hypothetical protein
MKKQVVSEIDIVSGTIDSPKGFEINREKIKNDIITSFINQKRISKNKKDFAYSDYEVPFSQPLQWLKDYLRDHFRIEHNKTLIPKLDFGIILDNDNRRVNRTWHVPLQNNKFIIFPSMQRFYITENKSSKLQTILISTYEYI